MRILGVGDTCDLGALYLRLQSEGHSVKVSIEEVLSHGTMAGLIERVDDWRPQLNWVREAGEDGIVVFENVGHGRGSIQDALRKDGFNVIGGSAFGDRLENDRAYAQKILQGLGLQTATTVEFKDYKSAAHFIDQNPARYVVKFSGTEFSSSDNYVGWSPSGHDTKAVLFSRLKYIDSSDASFILMACVEGIEMGVGAYFDGEKFIGNACLDWEHKRFFPGDIGELTGEMGTVVTYTGSKKFFNRTLHKVGPLLRENNYCGYINLNTIVNAEGIWPLEFTCRFGYPGFAVLTPLQITPWGELFKTMVSRKGRFATRSGFCVGIVLTTPPFPYTRKIVTEAAVGLPVCIEEIPRGEAHHLHYGEVGLSDGQLVTSGVYGWTMVVTGIGTTLGAARRRSLQNAGRVRVPKLRYRNDIGEKLDNLQFRQLKKWGFID